MTCAATSASKLIRVCKMFWTTSPRTAKLLPKLDEKVERNTKCKVHNTFATVWKVVLSVFVAILFSELAVWALLNHADSDVLGICSVSTAENTVTSHTLPNGDVVQEVQDKPPNKNAHCSLLKLAGGVPAAVTP